MHCWGQRSCMGQPGVKLLRNAIWVPNLVGKTPDRRVVRYWGRTSCRGQPESTRGPIAKVCPMATRFGKRTHNALLALKVMQKPFWVNQSNCTKCPRILADIRLPNLVRTPDRSVRSAMLGSKVMQGSTRGLIAQECPIGTECG